MSDVATIDKLTLKYKMTHDVFFKRCMADIVVAREFFESYLPKDILSAVDLSSLRLEKSDFADTTLGKGISDILYSLQWNKNRGYLSLLLEHQSTPDKLMTFRIFKYMLQICDLHITHTKKKELPLIYPIILYTGRSAYTAPRSFFELFPDPALAKKFFTDSIYLLSLREIQDIDLQQKYHMGVVLSLMREIHTKDIFPHLQKLIPLFQFLGRENLHIVEDMLRYILDNGETKSNEEVVQLFSDSVPEEHKGKIMTIGERLIEKGIEKERFAMINKMHKKLSTFEISSVTGLSVTEIERILQKKCH